MIASSVWLEETPADRPTLVLAEGALPYLTQAGVRQLLARLTDRFPRGELVFDGVAGANSPPDSSPATACLSPSTGW